MLETSVIPIEFDEQTIQDATKLKIIFAKNPTLFKIFLSHYKKISFKDTHDQKTLKLSSVRELKNILKNTITGCMTKLKYEVYEKGKEETELMFLKTMILDFVLLCDDNNINQDTAFKIKENINEIYAVVAMDYYKEMDKPEQIIEFIFNPNIKEKNNIFKWLNKKHRYNLINLLLKEEYQTLLELENIEQDTYLRTHLEELLKLSTVDDSKKHKNQKDNNIELPMISRKQLDDFCIEFFIEIDPSLKWLNLYYDLKKNNQIIYEKESSDLNCGWACIESKEKKYIYAPLTGTIKDFTRFIHEFAHYIAIYNKGKDEYISSALLEFPSIFFEYYAINFLRKKEYPKETISELEKERKKVTHTNMSNITSLLRYLTDYINYGEITLEKEKNKVIKKRETLYSDSNNPLKKIFNDYFSVSIEDEANINIDRENVYLVVEPNCLFEQYPYVVGMFLTDKAIMKVSNNPALINTMISITENLSTETYEGVLNKLGFTENPTKSSENKQYKKEKNEN